jgi:GxxExxY protein
MTGLVKNTFVLPQMAQITTDDLYSFKKETYDIIGICMKVHRTLGHGFLEVVYKQAIEIELTKKKISYLREKEYTIEYEGMALAQRFYADFIVFDKIILEIKATFGGISPSHISQLINYLKVSGCHVGLLINFGRDRLEYNRFVF